MKIYTIATETHECYGHGDYGNELRICKAGAYGSGKFPPVFKTREQAANYLDTIELNAEMEIVELELQNK